MTTEFLKDPSAKLNYTVDWADWLDSDDIASVSWTVPVGLTASDASNTTTEATTYLSGGTAGSDYLVTCQITTTGGLIDQRSFTIKVREQ